MRALTACLAMMMINCGGGEAADPQAEASAGGEAAESDGSAEEMAEEASDADADADAEPEPQAPAPSGPATISFKLSVKGEAIAGTIKIRDDGGTVLTEGEAGQPISIESGAYRAEVRASTDGLIDGPIKWVELELKPGDNPAVEVAFPWAKVRLDVKVNGKPAKGKVELLRRGESVATLPIAADEHILISPGRYQGKIKTGRSEIEVSQIVIPEGATRNVPINVTW